MKLTTKHLKEMVAAALKEQVLEQGRHKEITSVGIPVHIYAHKKNGIVTYHIESTGQRINAPLPHGSRFDGYSETSKKGILYWIKDQLNSMERVISGADSLEEQMAHNNGLNTVAQGKEGSLEEVAGGRTEEAKAKLSELIKNIDMIERGIAYHSFPGNSKGNPQVLQAKRTESSRLRVILKHLNAIMQLL